MRSPSSPWPQDTFSCRHEVQNKQLVLGGKGTARARGTKQEARGGVGGQLPLAVVQSVPWERRLASQWDRKGFSQGTKGLRGRLSCLGRGQRGEGWHVWSVNI